MNCAAFLALAVVCVTLGRYFFLPCASLHPSPAPIPPGQNPFQRRLRSTDRMCPTKGYVHISTDNSSSKNRSWGVSYGTPGQPSPTLSPTRDSSTPHHTDQTCEAAAGKRHSTSLGLLAETRLSLQLEHTDCLVLWKRGE